MSTLLPTRRTLAWAGIGLAVLALVAVLWPVLPPFLVAAIAGYALHPLVERTARRMPRALAVLLVETVLVLAVLGLVLLMVPILSKELPLLREQLPLLLDRANAAVGPWLAQFGIDVVFDTASVKAHLLKLLNTNYEAWIGTVLASARVGGGIALAVVGQAVLIPVLLFYLLMDWPRLMRQLHALVPPRRRPAFDDFFGECDTVLGQYLRGQALVMGALAVLYSAGLLAFGFDLAIPVGVFTGLAVFIPYLGFGLGLVLALLAALLQFGSFYGVAAVAVVYGIGQAVESFYLTPKLVGGRIGMSPLAVIFALFAFGELFGFAGVLMALPASAVLGVVVRRLRARYLASRLYLA